MWLNCSRGGLISLLHKNCFLRTQSRFLQCDVIVQVGKFPPGEIGDEFKAFIGVAFGLHVPHQCLGTGMGTA